MTFNLTELSTLMAFNLAELTLDANWTLYWMTFNLPELSTEWF